MLRFLVLQQVIPDASQKDESEHLAWYAEQCNAAMVATVLTVPFPLLERDDHTLQQVRGNGTRLPDGSQDRVQTTSHGITARL